MTAMRPRALFLSHGGGPCFFMKGSGPLSQLDSDSPPSKWYRTFAKKWPKPSAIVVASAHWEGTKGCVQVTTGAEHPLYYDYYGFPQYTYEIEYKCPGEPALANRILGLLREEGFQATGEERRGYDHGVFLPLKLMYPEADIPVVQVSLLENMDSDEHLKLGKVLRRIAEEDDGILIVGSGQATHNLSEFYPDHPPNKATPREEEFVSWLKETTTDPSISPDERERRLARWEELAPHARVAHPREEHLLPLHVAAASAGFTAGEVIYEYFVLGGLSLASVAFWGENPRDDSGSPEPGVGAGRVPKVAA